MSKELVDSVSVPGYPLPWVPEYEYSPPIPSIVDPAERHNSSNKGTAGRSANTNNDRFYSRTRGEQPRDRDAVFWEEGDDEYLNVKPSNSRNRRRNKNIAKNKDDVERLLVDSSDSDFDDGSDYEEDEVDEENEDGDEDEELTEDGERHSTDMKHTDSFDLEDEEDEMGIEHLQRAARNIKFSKMPVRAKDLIPDVDQMLSTYIQTSKRRSNAPLAAHSKYDTTKGRKNKVGWDNTATDHIGLAGKADSRHGTTFLQSSSYKRGLSFEKRLPAAWSQISMESLADGAALNNNDIHSTLVPAPDLQDDSEKDDDDSGNKLEEESPKVDAETVIPEEEVFELGELKSLDKLPKLPLTLSRLTELIKLSQLKVENPFQKFASASGEGELHPLALKIYRPSSDTPRVPFEAIVKSYVTVAETIGFALYRYWEEKRTPEFSEEKGEYDLNNWTLRIIEEDGEPDLDFPALDRKRIISAFSFDEFALVEA